MSTFHIDGDVLEHWRQDLADDEGRLAEKRLWWTTNGGLGLNGRRVAALPLYLAERLASAPAGVPAVVTEGEPAGDALLARRVLAVGTVCGAAATPSDDALRPLLGRPVILWPDNDPPGERHMRRIAAALARLGHADVRIVHWADGPAKGDAADFTGSADEHRALLDAAEPWQAVAADAAEVADGPAPVLVLLADVQPEQVRWLWPGRIPLGKLTILDGDPGLGKSLLTLDLAARVSAGRPMPDGTYGLGAPGGVVLLSAEDDLADTIRPRLDAAGADCSRIGALTAVCADDKERFATLGDIAVIREAIARLGERVDARLVVIDPLMAYIATDAHVDADVRSRLAPLTKLAAELGVAVVVVRHLNKAGGGNALYRGGGSIGIIAAARAGLLVAPEPGDATGERRILACTKSSLAKMPPALAYRIEAGAAGAVRITWLGETAHTASQLLASPAGDDERDAVAEACGFIREALMDGPRPSNDLQREARAAGIADHTLRRARESLGIRPQRLGFGSAGEWMWALPEQASREPKMSKMPIDAHPLGMGIYGADGHLSSPARSLGVEEGEL
ncbi:MAG: AAA family ATPase [Chloroflexi bacterium]|nr:AAA family ATPase [Chloroflexota bacterium]